MSYALQRLAHNALGACARLLSKIQGALMSEVLSHDEAFDLMPWFCQQCHMVQRVWGPSCPPTLPRDHLDISHLLDG